MSTEDAALSFRLESKQNGCICHDAQTMPPDVGFRMSCPSCIWIELTPIAKVETSPTSERWSLPD